MTFDKTAYQREYMRKRRAAAATVVVAIAQQSDEHVKVWFATLNAVKRLDFKSFVRRSLLGRGHLWVPPA